ncbi:MAG: maltotransferase domain-containing protein, partial [Dehalococcoidia bacterium]|nr:maltotransferase domain-containing protein [Dehalococcoidia bacterium]
MNPVINDRWQGFFRITEPVNYVYTVTAWMDKFKSWRVDLLKRVKADQDITVHLLSGARLISEASHNASGLDADALQACAETMESAKVSYQDKARCALAGEITLLMDKYQDRRFATTYQREVEVSVEREKARFSAWYEMFPRSCSPEEGRHGTFKDCENMLPYVASMGFDVLYLPPVHPIGESHRKGKNNTSPVKPGDPGSPWAIGSPEGGHKAIHPELGTIEDFRHLVGKARENNIEIALDLAFQCSPDHPYVKEHPEWFNWRPDGTIQYAENPPKKYQDIYPINFDTEQWQELWDELKSIVVYWAEQGIRFFRVDNPHTKPFPFWEWLIKEVKKDYPDVLLLAEAFTRPKVMLQLARLGFTQSYTYFAWRNTKAELTQYFTELNETDIREYFRPNLWINTPDILTEYLQFGGRTAFISRLVLAAMLGASYGIYGPAFELCENRPR